MPNKHMLSDWFYAAIQTARICVKITKSGGGLTEHFFVKKISGWLFNQPVFHVRIECVLVQNEHNLC